MKCVLRAWGKLRGFDGGEMWFASMGAVEKGVWGFEVVALRW